MEVENDRSRAMTKERVDSYGFVIKDPMKEAKIEMVDSAYLEEIGRLLDEAYYIFKVLKTSIPVGTKTLDWMDDYERWKK